MMMMVVIDDDDINNDDDDNDDLPSHSLSVQRKTCRAASIRA